MEFKQWLETNENFFSGVGLAPMPGGQLRGMPEPPDYSEFGPVNFHDSRAGFIKTPIAGKFVMDLQHKLFIANERSHERVCAMFGIDENTLVHGYYAPGGGHKIWPIHENQKDNIFGLESLRILVGHKFAKSTDAVEFLGQKTTVGDILSQGGQEILGKGEDNGSIERNKAEIDYPKYKKFNRSNLPDTPEGRKAWFYRYGESFNHKKRS